MLLAISTVLFVILILLWVRRSRRQPLLQDRTREDFARQLQTLMVLYENGGVLAIHGRDTGIEIEYERVGGSERRAEIVLRILRPALCGGHTQEVRDALLANNYDVREGRHLQDGVVLEVYMEVDDIWDGSAGRRGARAAQIALDVIGIVRTERFDSRIEGRRRWRAALEQARWR